MFNQRVIESNELVRQSSNLGSRCLVESAPQAIQQEASNLDNSYLDTACRYVESRGCASWVTCTAGKVASRY